MKILLILNDPPYGTERSYNGLRLAKTLAKKGAEVTVFLMADAVACTRHGQKVPPGYYNLKLMVKSVLRGGEVLLCGTCMDARGLTDETEVVFNQVSYDIGLGKDLFSKRYLQRPPKQWIR
ncbi:DsrE/DsrF/TusD sulfur relay family protein [Candidatus Thiosymbion oneisti]|uniref:DsrE/DsrF/TusD sulfur relay family protein n=1 Tax=Candidatus Thiosymbion oneisti TaxID=589554 RepID=UPI000A3F5970|nr:DsrE family protein [Candidatus Thiosymbion oneisti]